MNILLYNAYYVPEIAAGIYLSENIASAFANAGNNVKMYVPTPTRGISLEVREEYVRHKKIEDLYEGRLHIERYNLVREKKNPIVRAARYFLQNIKQYRLGMNTDNVDLIFCGSTPPTQGWIISILKRRLSKKLNRNIPFVYNLHDVFPDSLVGTGLAKKGGLLWKIGRKVENFTYKNADKIIVISEDIKQNIMAKGVPEEKIEVVYNWVDENSVHPVEAKDNTLYDEFGINRDKFTIVYACNLGNAQNIFLIVDAAERLKDNQEIQFVIFGSNGLEQELRNRIEEKQLKNIQLLPLQPYERVSEVYSLGDACIVACKAGLGGAAMPSKTWSIMSCGRPVLANFDEGELKMIVEKNNCGKFTKADDLDGFVNAIVELSKDREGCKKMGENGRQFVLDNLTKEVGTQKYVDVIKSVIKEH